MLFTDIDSLTYEIKSKDVYELFKRKHLFDFSNYPEDSKCFDPTNKKVKCKMKYYSEGKIMSEFVGLKSMIYPMYSILMVKNLIRQTYRILQLRLMNSKTLSSTKK